MMKRKDFSSFSNYLFCYFKGIFQYCNSFFWLMRMIYYVFRQNLETRQKSIARFCGCSLTETYFQRARSRRFTLRFRCSYHNAMESMKIVIFYSSEHQREISTQNVSNIAQGELSFPNWHYNLRFRLWWSNIYIALIDSQL